MAERKATNKYYPPDWDPSKGSINKYVGQHPLRDRARKLDQGILIVRFEMPFHVWCGGCERHIARGVRFNAEKKEIGRYHSTPILSFRMKCPSCSQWIEIHTDPASSEYLVVSGGKRKMESFDPEAVGLPRPKTKEETEKLIYNPFFKMEHDLHDAERAREAVPKLQTILVKNEQIFKDDFGSSGAARKRLRAEKVEIARKEKQIDDLKTRLDIHGLPLLPEREEDAETAGSVQFRKPRDRIEKRVVKLKTSSIFGKSASTKASSSKNILDQLNMAGPKSKR